MKIALIGLHDDKNLGDPIITESFEYLYRQFRQEDSFIRINIEGYNKINDYLYRILMKLGRMLNIAPWRIYRMQARKYYRKELKKRCPRRFYRRRYH